MRDFAAAHTVQITLSVLGFVLLLVVYAIFAAIRASQRRRANLREWAFRNGYDYTQGPLPAYDLAPLDSVEVKGNVTRTEAVNVTRGSRVTLFDLRKTTKTYHGLNKRVRYGTKTTSVAVFKLPDALPRFQFSAVAPADPSSLQGKLMNAVVDLAQFVGMTPGDPVIPIEGRPGFLLRAQDADGVKAIFAPDRVHFFDDKPGWSVESDKSYLMVSCDPTIYEHGWERGTNVSEKNYDEFARMSQQIYEQFTS